MCDDAKKVADETADMAACIEAVAQRRDHASFARFFSHCGPRIIIWLHGRGLPYAVAEELTQDAFVAAWHGAASYNPGRDDPFLWVLGFARKITDRAMLHRAKVLDAAVLVSWKQRDAVAPDDAAAAQRRAVALRAALQSLDPAEMELLVDVYRSGRTHTQIAAQRGVPLGTVKSTLARLKAALARAVRRAETDREGPR